MLETALDDILAAKVSPGCKFGQWIAGLDADDRSRLEEILAHPDVTSLDIVTALDGHFNLSSSTVRRHRRWVTDGVPGCGCQ